MGLEQTLQTGTFWQAPLAKPSTIITLEPAVEGSKETAFECKQDANRH
jgi:hypothetical protein